MATQQTTVKGDEPEVANGRDVLSVKDERTGKTYELEITDGTIKAPDLRQIKVPTYVTGATNDHLTPWKGCYRTTQLMSGETTFALSNAGHIASLVNPPGNPKANYYTAPVDPTGSPQAWLESAENHTGSWWEHWADWAIGQSGDQIPAPETLGSVRFPAQTPAPGTYVRQSN